MNVLGTAYMNGCNYQVGYDLLSTNQAGGYHTLRVYGVLNVTNNYISWSRGTARVWDKTVGIGTYYGRGSYTLVSTDINAYCDASGNVSVYIGGNLDTSFVSSGEVGGTAYLPNIPRYPVLNSGSNFKDTENPVFNITAYGAYPIRVKLEAGGNAQLITRDLSSRNSQVYTLTLTSEERELLRSLTSGNTLAVRETVCAMSGKTELSVSYKDYTMIKTAGLSEIRVNGQWKQATPYVRVNGQWKQATPYTRVNNQWKEGI